jgi:hypothetical protein
MGEALWPFWWIHSSFAEAIHLMHEALQHEGKLTSREHLLASLVLGLMAFGHGEEAQAVPYLQAAASNPDAEPRELATARIPLGLVLSEQGDDSGVELLRHVVEEFRATAGTASRVGWTRSRSWPWQWTSHGREPPSSPPPTRYVPPSTAASGRRTVPAPAARARA